MNLFTKWRKLLGLKRKDAAVTLGVRSRMTLNRYRQGGIPDTRVLIQMIYLAYEHDEEAGDAFIAYIREHAPTLKPTVADKG